MYDWPSVDEIEPVLTLRPLAVDQVLVDHAGPNVTVTAWNVFFKYMLIVNQ